MGLQLRAAVSTDPEGGAPPARPADSGEAGIGATAISNSAEAVAESSTSISSSRVSGNRLSPPEKEAVHRREGISIYSCSFQFCDKMVNCAWILEYEVSMQPY